MVGSICKLIANCGHGAGFFSSEGMVRRCGLRYTHGAGIAAKNNRIVAKIAA